jgi:hypothetical protein
MANQDDEMRRARDQSTVSRIRKASHVHSGACRRSRFEIVNPLHKETQRADVARSVLRVGAALPRTFDPDGRSIERCER